MVGPALRSAVHIRWKRNGPLDSRSFLHCHVIFCDFPLCENKPSLQTHQLTGTRGNKLEVWTLSLARIVTVTKTLAGPVRQFGNFWSGADNSASSQEWQTENRDPEPQTSPSVILAEVELNCKQVRVITPMHPDTPSCLDQQLLISQPDSSSTELHCPEFISSLCERSASLHFASLMAQQSVKATAVCSFHTDYFSWEGFSLNLLK